MRGLVMVELQLIGHQVLRILCSSREFPRGLYIGEKGYSIRIAKKKDDRGSSRNGAIDRMAENWVGERDRAILDTIYYCENCNMVLDTVDNEVQQHKKELPHHKMRKV